MIDNQLIDSFLGGQPPNPWSFGLQVVFSKLNTNEPIPGPKVYCLSKSSSNLSALSLSQLQAILVAVQRYNIPRDNSGRIGRPRYKNPKIKKETGERRTLYRYI